MSSFEKTTSNYGYVNSTEKVQDFLSEWEFENTYGTVTPRVIKEDTSSHDGAIYITGSDLFHPYKPSTITGTVEVNDFDPIGFLQGLAPHLETNFKLQTIGGENYVFPFTVILYTVDAETNTVNKITHNDVCERVLQQPIE